jgi:hypothetical protein
MVEFNESFPSIINIPIQAAKCCLFFFFSLVHSKQCYIVNTTNITSDLFACRSDAKYSFMRINILIELQIGMSKALRECYKKRNN